MKFTLTCPVYTVAVITALEEVMKNLAATKKLEHVWVVDEVKTNLKFGGNDEVGIVIYPCRRSFWSKKLSPIKEKRIVMKPLPCGGKVKTAFLEIGFGDRVSRDPLLGTADCPVKRMIGGDKKYNHDFFLIIESLKEILDNITAAAASYPEQQKVVAIK